MKWKSIAFVAALVAVGLPALAALADWCASRPPMERPGGRGCTERSGPLASVAEGEARAGKGVCKMPPNVAAKCGRIADARDAACSDQGMSVPGGDATSKRLGAKDARCRRCEDPESGQSYIARVDGDAIDDVRLAGGVEPKSPCELARKHWRLVCGDPNARPRECAEARRQRDDACGGPPVLTIALDGLAQLVGAVLGDDPAHAGATPTKCRGTVPHGFEGATSLTGRCVITCERGGWVDCDGKPDNGCEVNVQADPKNCGACAKACGSGYACVNEKCTPAEQKSSEKGPTPIVDYLASFASSLLEGVAHADEAPVEAKICMSTCGDDGEPGKSPWCYYVGTRFSTAAAFHCDPRQCVGAIRQDWIARRVKLPFLRMTEPDCLRACRWLSKKTATESGCDAL